MTGEPVVRRDLVYAAPPGFRPLALDLYLPAEPAAVVCLYLHGGGWRLGSRRVGPGAAASWFFEHLTANGVAVASLDYRLSGEARFPAPLEDVRAAARHLLDRRDEFGLPAAQAVWGVSAGGQLAALHALSAVDTALAVRAAVCWYTPTDLDALSADVRAAGGEPDRSATSREGALLGGALDDVPEQVRRASAVHAVREGAPPFLLVHGTADRAVPPRQSRRLAEALAVVGAPADVDLIEGATHMFPELDDRATAALVDRGTQFLLAAPPHARHLEPETAHGHR